MVGARCEKREVRGRREWADGTWRRGGAGYKNTSVNSQDAWFLWYPAGRVRYRVLYLFPAFVWRAVRPIWRHNNIGPRATQHRHCFVAGGTARDNTLSDCHAGPGWGAGRIDRDLCKTDLQLDSGQRALSCPIQAYSRYSTISATAVFSVGDTARAVPAVESCHSIAAPLQVLSTMKLNGNTEFRGLHSRVLC
jgi:hypothetical protein